jgi:hypothetical protein
LDNSFSDSFHVGFDVQSIGTAVIMGLGGMKTGDEEGWKKKGEASGGASEVFAGEVEYTGKGGERLRVLCNCG